MRRPRGVRALLAALLALTLAMLAIVQPASTMAQATTQQTQSQQAGSATVTFGPSWQYDPDISDATSAFLTNSKLQGTLYIHVRSPMRPSPTRCWRSSSSPRLLQPVRREG